MKVDKESMVLYAVSDRAWLNQDSLDVQVEKAIKGGATFIQLREKNLGYHEFLESARKIKRITDQYEIPFVINDNVEVALAVNADGVHIGQNDEQLLKARKKLGPHKIIGMSAHNVEEAMKAEESGADYIGVGAVFSTTTKLDANHVSFPILKEICNTVNLPVVAIGGISKDNLQQLAGSGVDGVAVISAIFAQLDIENAAKELFLLSSKMVNDITN